MSPFSEKIDRSGGVTVSGSIEAIYGDIVGGNKVGLDEDKLIALLETHGFLIRKVSEELRSLPRGKPRTRDAKRMSQYFQLFERNAFEIPCIFEGSLSWLDEAIDQIQTAFGTGHVVFRDSRKTAFTIPRRAEFETQPYKDTLQQISKMLLLLKHETSSLIQMVEEKAPGSFSGRGLHHMELLICSMIDSGISRPFIAAMIERMDQIDHLRNVILDMLGRPRIPVSSTLLKESPRMRKYDWANYYLRCHQTINDYLVTDDT